MAECEITDFTYPLLADIYYPLSEQGAYGNVKKTWILDKSAACYFSPSGRSSKSDVQTDELVTIQNSIIGRFRTDITDSTRGAHNSISNIIITNIKDNYMYKYDEGKGVFVLSNKNEVLNSLVDYRLGDLEIIYNDLLEKNKIDERTKKCIEEFINKINYDDNKFVNGDREHENFKQYKINEIKVLLFNNQDKITNDISLLLTTNEQDIPILTNEVIETDIIV